MYNFYLRIYLVLDDYLYIAYSMSLYIFSQEFQTKFFFKQSQQGTEEAKVNSQKKKKTLLSFNCLLTIYSR